MKNEFIIINKTTLEEKLNSLKEQREREPDNYEKSYLNDMIKQLEFMLSQSTPLIPEIEKHSIEFTKTLLSCTVSEAKSIDNIKEYHPKEYQLLLGELELNGKKIFEDYISNLKLDI